MTDRFKHLTLCGAVLAALSMLTACGGGGGGSSSSPPGGATSPTGDLSLSGSVTDDASPSPVPLAGATVALYPTGVKLAGLQPLATATTAANGTWSIAAGPAAGTYVLQIAPADSAHATLHKDVTLAAGANAIGTTRLTILSAAEQQYITLFNLQCATLGVPALTADNAAMIAARAEAQAIAVWSGSGSAPAVEGTTYTSAGGVLGSISGAYDSGASDCTMATSNLFSSAALQTIDGSASAVWLGFGIAPQTVGGVTADDYAAAVVTYP